MPIKKLSTRMLLPARRDHLRALSRLCRQLGGRLAIVSQDAFDDRFVCRYECLCASHEDGTFHESPFASGYGLHWHEKIVYAVRGHAQVGPIIHEMGHVFADDKPPPDCCEWDWLGWEIAVAQWIGAWKTYSEQNGHYCVDESGKYWGNLSTKQLRRLVTNRLAHAKKLGLISKNGAPRSIR